MSRPNPIIIEKNICGRKLRIETGVIGKQADSVLVSYGETVVFCAVTNAKPRAGIDFFPLTVDYRERMYAAGKIPGGFFKRESRPSTAETLTSRAIDRPLRPMFPKEYRDEVNINIMTLAYDKENDPEVLAMFAASAALCISPCPFLGPVGVARVGRIHGQLVLNPTFSQMSQSDMELNVSATDDLVVMLEAEGSEIPEKQMMEAIKMAHELCRELNAMQLELVKRAGKEKIKVEPFELNKDIYSKVKKLVEVRLEKSVTITDKETRRAEVDDLLDEAIEACVPADATNADELTKQANEAFEKVRKTVMRTLVLDKNTRTDGRPFDKVRDIWVQTQCLPRVHGSALFSRGQTQCLSIVTLGSPADQQRIEGLNEMRTERFMLHYNFPHFSVGECGPNRGAGRREIGHGELAERSLRPMLPSEEDFPYTIRLVADIMESAGSTSMAAVCAGSLSMFDAGIPMKSPVAGISVGLITRDGDISDYKLLTDIYDEEDFTGDMDFKVAGTNVGITGVQCDMKVLGISQDIIAGAFEAARKARLGILEIMSKELVAPRPHISGNAPQMETLMINPLKIGAVIGPGGSVIREIEATAKAKLDISDDGKIVVTSNDRNGLETAKNMILNLTQELREGEIYDATVTSVKNFGMFVECLPGQEGLVHVTELSYDYVESVESLFRKGDKVKVKCLGIDAQKRARLSVKALLDKPEGYVEPAEGHRSQGAEGGGFSRDRGDRQGGGEGRGRRPRPRYED